MTTDRIQRRMAAVLAADMVGYSRLVGKDEETTLATLKTYREIIDGLIKYHEGRVFRSAGDSVIAEFASPVEAVRCATEIQLAIDEQNARLPEQSRMRFRIGINLGDIVVDGTNLMGDGVNVAARLEALAPPGGICVSEAIHAQVRDRLSLNFLDLGEHKVKNIVRPVRAYRVPLASEEQVTSPFRGLDVFDFDHADLFFGRAQAISTCVERLERLSASGKAFLLIYGSSGSGKSSLLRAGLLPHITRSDAIPGIVLWRRCVIRPSEAADPFTSLAAGLLRDGALPELAPEQAPANIVDLLRSAPDRVVGQIRSGLAKAAAAPGHLPSQARLVLAVDQLEELFTPNTNPVSHEGFVRLLAAFAGSGAVWVIGTIRGDFYHRCSEIPGFSALKDGLSSFELLPPTGPEIAQIVREPARTAGLRFEEDPDRGRLDDVLQAAAMADRGSLPLLEFVLDALYEAGRERRVLTFAAYRALGGLDGAIARRADELVDGLPAENQNELAFVLRALTTVRLGDEAITGRPALLSEVSATSSQSALVSALISARLLVTDEDAEGRAVVRLAHEALINRWPRAREIADADRNFLETRARIHADAHRWTSERKNPDLLLPSGKRLAEGEELLAYRRAEVDDQIIAYIEASSLAEKARLEKERQAERMRIEAEGAATRERLQREAERFEHEAERRKLDAAAARQLARRTRIAAAIALVLGIGAAAGALVGFRGQTEAMRQAERAEKNASHAEESARQAFRNQSLSLSLLSEQTAIAGDTEAAILLALEALPKNISTPERPLVFEAEAALYGSLLKHHQAIVLHHDAGLTDAAFSPDGNRIVTASLDKTARIWNAHDGSELAILRGHQGAVDKVTFNPDGSRVISAGRDGTARVWNAVTGEQLLVLNQPGDIRAAVFSPDGTQLLTASDVGGLTIWDGLAGNQIARKEGANFSAMFAPDGHNFATGSSTDRTIRIWSAANGELVKSLFVQTYPNDFKFSPDGRRILVSSFRAFSSRQPSRLFNVSSGLQIATISAHKSDIHCGIFSHDGRLAATVSVDGTVRLWDAISGSSRGVLGNEAAGLMLDDAGLPRDQAAPCAFSPDDRLLATSAIDGTVRIWDVKIGSQPTVLRGQGDLVERLAFSPDGSRLLTALRDGTAQFSGINGVLTTSLYHKDAPTFAVFSSDGSRLLTGGGNSATYVWDAASGREIAVLVTHGGPTAHSVFSPDGRFVATASQNGRILMWDAATGRQIAQLQDKSSAVATLQFSSDGQALVSSSTDGSVNFWNASSGALVAAKQAGGALRAFVLSPDGSLALAVLVNGSVRLWNIDGSDVQAVVQQEKGISAAGFSLDGRMLATGFFDGTVRLWSVKDGAVATFKGQGAPITCVTFSQDARLLATASREGTIHIWNTANGETVAALRESGVVTEVAFSPNAAFLVTVSPQHARVRLWSISAGRELAVLAGSIDDKTEPAVTHAAFNSDGTQVAVVSGDKVARIIRVFPTAQALIDYTRTIVPRQLSPCERRRFFLPVEGDVGLCPN